MTEDRETWRNNKIELKDLGQAFNGRSTRETHTWATKDKTNNSYNTINEETVEDTAFITVANNNKPGTDKGKRTKK